MLCEFVTVHRDAIIAAANSKSNDQQRAEAPAELLTLFLNQLAKALQRRPTATAVSSDDVGSAGDRGDEFLGRLDVAEVVRQYAEIRAAIVEHAVHQRASISSTESLILNGFVDAAIARAVTEHARLAARKSSTEEVERLGHAAHELRNMLHTAVLAFQTLKQDSDVSGNAGVVLGRSLMGLQTLIDRTVAEVRLAAGTERHERVTLAKLLDDVAVLARLHAEYNEIRFVVEHVDPVLTVNVDAPLLTSAVMNLLTNAFKYCRSGGQVLLRAHQQDNRVHIEVEDECGGIPDTKDDPFQAFGDRRGRDRTGLGLGLSIARKAVRAQGGDIRILNMPGKGCIFTIEVPLAATASLLAPAVGQ